MERFYISIDYISELSKWLFDWLRYLNVNYKWSITYWSIGRCTICI